MACRCEGGPVKPQKAKSKKLICTACGEPVEKYRPDLVGTTIEEQEAYAKRCAALLTLGYREGDCTFCIRKKQPQKIGLVRTEQHWQGTYICPDCSLERHGTHARPT